MGNPVAMPSSGTAERLIGDRYALITPLGKGGMGVVWEAEDRLLRRRVAIKEVRLPPAVPASEQASLQGRVLREARAAGRINDSGAVTVFDVHQESGTAYIVMELVEGTTLSELVKERGSLPPSEVATIGLGVLGALESAHRQGIVHRDVKPANVMVTPDGRVKLADFGIASLKDDPKITATGLVLGSPSYMAPEQAEGRPTGPELDLWALGATMYFAVEGKAPFDRGATIPTLTAVLHEDPRPMTQAGSLEPVIRALLRKSPADRPSEQSLRAMLERVTAGAGGEEASTRGIGAVPPRPSVAPIPPAEPMGRPAPGPRSNRAGGWLVAVALLAAAGLVALSAILLSGDDRERQEASGRERRAERRDNAAAAPPEPSPEASSPEPSSPEPSADATSPSPAPIDGDLVVPAGWATYQDPETGYQVAYPEGWEIVDDSVDASSTDFRDPASSTYLRVDWTDTPGRSPKRAWVEFEKSYRTRHENYDRIRIEATSFQGMRAAIWEFTYTDGGADLHALDLGFVTDDGRYGFALYWQTRADEWDSLQSVFEGVRDSYRPPG